MTKNKAKFNILAALGWLLWKLLALFGSHYAKKKLEERRKRREQAEAGPLKRGIRAMTDRSD